ncbi:hypothetical protein [Mycobacterium sp. NAZ190054]|uniref:hypothetical protein n=1 Tax=Mycobacterium sp. NAZ190054 TaxID=1747766 RepID=UPI0012E360F1|nr:hypothetical protein [Mycobacterium sp. NAZ190054]
MATILPPEARRVACCPACGYPTLDASVCALCSPLTAGVVPTDPAKATVPG